MLTEVISVTPAIWARRRSSGAAREEATVAGSAPGNEAETLIIGKSTRGMAATGMKWYAMMPARKRPMASNDVPTGRRMNGAQMFMTAEGRNPKAEGRTKAEVRRPRRASRSDARQEGQLR